MNIVNTFYHPVPQLGKADALIGLWKYTWEKRGWQTRVLGLSNAQANPRYAAFKDSVTSKTKSINPGDYDLMCWLRWLAFEQVGGGLMTDYDVINRSLTHDMVQAGEPTVLEGSAYPRSESYSGCCVYEISKVPCCVSADRDGAARIVSGIIDMPKNDGAHYSDMYWFNAQPFPSKPLCVEFHTQGWETAPAVHFANFACGRYRSENKVNLNREQLIRKFMLT